VGSVVHNPFSYLYPPLSLLYLFPKQQEEVLVNTCISPVQHLRPLRGGAPSHLLKASDGAGYVTKFQNNPQHIRVLTNEMLATRLGLALGLAKPRVEVTEISDWLIEHTEDLGIQLAGQRIPCRSGKQLGSIYAGSPGTTLASRKNFWRESVMWQTSPEFLSSTSGLQRRWKASSLHS